MKRFLLSVSLFIFSILFVACGGFGNNGSSQGQPGEIEKVEMLECNYDENGGFTFSNFEKGTLILKINGQEIQISEPSFNVSTLDLADGIYTINIYYYVNGELMNNNMYNYQKGEQKGDTFRVSFFDDRNNIIKEIFLEKGTLIEENLFPQYFDKEGVTYSWEYDFELGSEINRDLEAHLVGTYIKYTITYNLNGGSFNEEVEKNYTINSFDFVYPVPSKEGYVFDGWYENADFSGNQVSTLNLLNPKNITVYAKWIELTQETKNLISVIQDMLNSPQMTVTITSEGKKYEIAYDNSSTFYYHSLTNGKTDYLIQGNIHYSFSDMTFYKQNVKQEEYTDVLSLTSLSGQVISTSVKTNGGTTTYTSTMKNSNATLIITTNEGKVSEVTMTDGKEKETYKVTYTCKKVTIDTSKFTEKIFVNLYRIEIRNGVVPAIPTEQGRFDIKKGVKLKDCEFFNKEGAIYESFGGIYLDRERTQEIGLDYVINETIDLYWVDYGNIEELLEHYTFTLNVHCDCSECNGTKTYKDITYSDLNKVKHFENGKEEEMFDIVEEGKHIMGWFASSNEGAEQVSIFKLASEHLQQRKYYEDLVIDIYSQTKDVETVKVKLMCNCDKHVDLGYYEKDVIKGSWYWAWNDEHIKEGYMCEQLSLNEDLSSLEDGFQIDQDTTIYFNWVIDTRVNITVQAYDDKTGENTRKYYAKAEELYQMITQDLSGLQNGKIASGFYLDKALTKPYTSKTELKNGDIIYVKWSEAKQVAFHTIDGNFEYIIVPLDFDLSSVDWSKYNGSIPNESSSMIDDQIFKRVYYASQNSYEYVTLFEFYKDDARTQKITSLNGVSDVYLGYKVHPTVTFVCDKECTLEHSSQTYSSYNQIGKHSFMIGEEYYDVEYYLDEDYKIKLHPTNYQYMNEDFVVYGKKSLTQIDVNIDCNCLLHKNNIVGKFNSLQDALKDCDYGFGKGKKLPPLYTDLEGNGKIFYGEEFYYAQLPELYVLTGGKATVYCSCNIEGHDGTGFEIVLVKEDGWQRVLDMLEMEHRELYMEVPTQYSVYLDQEKTNQIYSDHQLSDGDNVYIDLKVDENFIPIKIVYGDKHTQTLYVAKNNYYSLPRAYEKYNVVGYYKDSSYSRPIETVEIDGYHYIIPEEISTIYCKLELAKTITFTYTNDLGQETVITKYLVGDSYAGEFYSYLIPSYGYMSYVVDSSNNRVDPNDLLKENETYREKTVKLENCIVITIECECFNCTQEIDNKIMILEDGTRINVVKNNTLLVEKGKTAIPYLRDLFSYHYDTFNSAEIRDMRISLTKGGEPLNTEVFMYFGSMLDDAPYKYAYNEDTTLYFAFQNVKQN